MRAFVSKGKKVGKEGEREEGEEEEREKGWNGRREEGWKRKKDGREGGSSTCDLACASAMVLIIPKQ